MNDNELSKLFEKIGTYFGQLLRRMETLIEKLSKQGAVAFQRGDLTTANAILKQVKQINSIKKKINGCRTELDRIFEKRQGVPPEPCPLPVPPPGERTPERSFRRPILEALVELGGSGLVPEVLDRVEEKMRRVLTEYDRQSLPAGDSIRWRNAAQWARYRMVQEGLLARNSPRGIWEITELGRRELIRLQETARG
ncbi:MAG: winged helix-turn-helix domain-containing protein [Bacillota bacterium]